MDNAEYAPGWPGIPPRWTTSAKAGVGTALERHSQLWFTLSHGIINEVYYPRVDQACTRDMGLMVASAGGFFSEEKRHTRSKVSMPTLGVPLYQLVNICKHGRYRIENLRPGEYTLTFTLSGFSTVRREKQTLSGTGVVTADIQLRPGVVQETVTVIGGVPVVDVERAGSKTPAARAHRTARAQE